MFPLNAVLFPGVSMPLNVFEDRYRALVHHLLRAEPDERYFGSVGIREGYEIGEHGAQSLFRIGCRVKMTEVESHPDGTFSLVAVGMERISLEHLDVSGVYPVGHVEEAPGGRRARCPAEVVERAVATFTAYRVVLSEYRDDPFPYPLPKDPAYLSWTLAAVAPLPLHERQALLEAEDAGVRLAMVTELLRTELRVHERDPVAARHRGGADALVARTDVARDAGHRRPDARRDRLHAARVRPRPARRQLRARGRRGARARARPGVQDPARRPRRLARGRRGARLRDARPQGAGPGARRQQGGDGRPEGGRAGHRLRHRWHLPRRPEAGAPHGGRRERLLYDEVYVSAGRRGLDLGIAPADLVEVTGAIVADISR